MNKIQITLAVFIITFVAGDFISYAEAATIRTQPLWVEADSNAGKGGIVQELEKELKEARAALKTWKDRSDDFELQLNNERKASKERIAELESQLSQTKSVLNNVARKTKDLTKRLDQDRVARRLQVAQLESQLKVCQDVNEQKEAEIRNLLETNEQALEALNKAEEDWRNRISTSLVLVSKTWSGPRNRINIKLQKSPMSSGLTSKTI